MNDEELRKYWKNSKGTEETLNFADQIMDIIKEIDNEFEMKYTQSYIRLSKNGAFNWFIGFIPRKKTLYLWVR